MATTRRRAFTRAVTTLVVAATLTGVLASTAGAATASRGVAGTGGDGVPRVIGGQPATQGQFPWLVAVVMHDEPRPYEGQFCGGTVVAPNWVLTAWHCVIEFAEPVLNPDGTIGVDSYYADPAGIDVVAGQSDLTKAGGERVQAAQIVPMPGVSLAMDADGYLAPVNDAALIRLKAPLSVPPVRLATATDAALASPPAHATVAGWGTTTDPGNKTAPSYPPVAQFASLPIISNAGCTAAFGGAYVKASDLCAGAPGDVSPGQGSCFGDSGGPLASQDSKGSWVQIGIVSFGGMTCASSGTPGVFTRVSAISDWVRTTISYGPFAGPGPFVGGQLRDFTNREPSLASIFVWAKKMDQTSPSFVIRQLASSSAWTSTAGMTDRLYRAAFGRAADTGAMTIWTARLAARTPASQLGNALVLSAEFRARYGLLDDYAFIDHLYTSVLGTPVNKANRTVWARRLRSGTSRGSVLVTFAAQPAFTRRIAADTQIAQLWFGMLRAAPSAATTATWRGRSDQLVRKLITNPVYIGRTWPGINDVDFSDFDFDEEFSTSATGDGVQRIAVDSAWPAVKLARR